jgi:cystathionine beta-lyase
VIADEIHADLALPPHTFTPFAAVAGDADVRWAATQGSIKTFGLAAFEAAYRTVEPWLDDLLELVGRNGDLLGAGLPDGIGLVTPEGTYLAWLDCRGLGLDAPARADWLASSAHLALSPGHWFGREGAGFARMTIAAPTEQVEDAVDRLTRAVAAT